MTVSAMFPAVVELVLFVVVFAVFVTDTVSWTTSVRMSPTRLARLSANIPRSSVTSSRQSDPAFAGMAASSAKHETVRNLELDLDFGIMGDMAVEYFLAFDIAQRDEVADRAIFERERLHADSERSALRENFDELPFAD